MTAEASPPLPEPLERLARALPGLGLADVLGGAGVARATTAVDGSRAAAVLVLFSPGAPEGSAGGLDVVLVERAAGPGAHSGQVAFPGGGVDPGDASPVAAALREAREETGLHDDGLHVIGALPTLAVPVSRYVVTPVLAWQRVASALRAGHPAEIAAVHRVPTAVLADPANRVRVRVGGAPDRTGPAFVVDDLLVWGFTALLLDAVLRLAGLERDWPRDRVVDLPPRFAGPGGPA